MKGLKRNCIQADKHLYITILIVCFQLLALLLCGQSSYEIKLEPAQTQAENTICYDVLLKSGTAENWHLAGQNYRLYYDASKANFKTGQSLLGTAYQQFKLVQDAKIDASSIKGNIPFEEELGFLNYSIDLLNTTEGGQIVPADNSWLATSQICFEINENVESVENLAICQVWGRKGYTDEYAASFVEISAWDGINKTSPTIGAKYIDISTDCSIEAYEEYEEEYEEYEEEGVETNSGIMGEITNSFDLRLSPNEIESDATTFCYDVQLKSGIEENWYLAGQNYRLYYDASKVSFKSGNSFLGPKYQDFKLVQNLEVDASNTTGNIPFEQNLGFLNYSIDLLNTDNYAAVIPKQGDQEWLTTSQLCFALKEGIQLASANPFCFAWAEQGLTEEYATSFVEISAWTGINKTEAAINNNSQNVLDDCTVSQNRVVVNTKVFLQGAYDVNTKLMRDELRKKQLIPLEEPYVELGMSSIENQTTEGIDNAILEIEGDKAVVDWILIELRNPDDPVEISYLKSGLLLRNGEIVDLDGQSKLHINAPAGSYFLSIKHRNHLGVMTQEKINFDNNIATTMIDFTKTSTSVYGTDACKKEGEEMVLWGGNADGNSYIVFQGAGLAIPDSDKVFFDIFSDSTNVNYHYNHITRGYLNSDINMDGEVRYQGGENDIDEFIFFNVFVHPANENFFSNFYIEEQIPQRLDQELVENKIFSRK